MTLKRLLTIVCMLSLMAGVAAAQTTVHHFGDHPFHTPELTSPDDLRQMIITNKADLAEGFTRAGAQDLYAQMLIQLDDLEISSTQVETGDTFHWMMFAHNSTVYVRENVDYQGKEAVSAYSFTVDMDETRYHFIVPAICGNLSLAGTSEIPNTPPVCSVLVSPGEVNPGQTVMVDASASYDTDGDIASATFHLRDDSGATLETITVNTMPLIANFTLEEEGDYTIAVELEDDRGAMSDDPCTASVVVVPAAADAMPANREPQCAITVTPKRVFAGETIVVDATDSTDPDGSIESVTFTLIDENGNTVAEERITAAPFKTELVVPSAGDFQVKSNVMDDRGGSSGCGVLGIRGVARFGFLADIGVARQFDPATYVMGRIGAEYRFSENVSFMILAGGFPKVYDDEGASAFILDGLLTFNSRGRVWTGFGLGAWITDGDDDIEHENSQLDAIWNIGLKLWGGEGSSTSIFFEARSGIDEFDTLEEFGRFVIGLRFFF